MGGWEASGYVTARALLKIAHGCQVIVSSFLSRRAAVEVNLDRGRGRLVGDEGLVSECSLGTAEMKTLAGL